MGNCDVIEALLALGDKRETSRDAGGATAPLLDSLVDRGSSGLVIKPIGDAGNATESALATGNTCDDAGDAALAPRPLTPIPGGTSTKSATIGTTPGLFLSATTLFLNSGLK
jgi:hypothetical protein